MEYFNFIYDCNKSEMVNGGELIAEIKLPIPRFNKIKHFNLKIKRQVANLNKHNIKPEYLIVSSADYEDMIAWVKQVYLPDWLDIPVVIAPIGDMSPLVFTTKQYFNVKSQILDKSSIFPISDMSPYIFTDKSSILKQLTPNEIHDLTKGLKLDRPKSTTKKHLKKSTKHKFVL